jgi:hypothetical protein
MALANLNRVRSSVGSDKLATLRIIPPAVSNHSLACRFLRAKAAAIGPSATQGKTDGVTGKTIEMALKPSVTDRRSNARMTNSNEYRLRAEECLQKASLANSDADKHAWLTLFNGWLPLNNLRQTMEQKLAKSRPKLEIVR